MALPPLYKFLDIRGAKLTLGNGTFKHAKPSDFNDVEDLTVQSIFQEDLEVALQKITLNFTDLVLRHVDDKPTCASPIKEKLAILQYTFRMNPDAAKVIQAELEADGGKSVYDVEHMRKICDEFISEINAFMQLNRVLCVTTAIESNRMWSAYAEEHHGVAIRIEPNTSKDSKFQRFRPVDYCEHRPPFYDNPMDFIAGSLFGDKEARATAAMNRIIYSKTLAWQHECEYRLVIPLRNGEPPWDTLPYHPEEVTELYLGHAMTEADRSEIGEIARRRNPQIAVFQARMDANGAVSFDKL